MSLSPSLSLSSEFAIPMKCGGDVCWWEHIGFLRRSVEMSCSCSSVLRSREIRTSSQLPVNKMLLRHCEASSHAMTSHRLGSGILFNTELQLLSLNLQFRIYKDLQGLKKRFSRI